MDGMVGHKQLRLHASFDGKLKILSLRFRGGHQIGTIWETSEWNRENSSTHKLIIVACCYPFAVFDTIWIVLVVSSQFRTTENRSSDYRNNGSCKNGVFYALQEIKMWKIISKQFFCSSNILERCEISGWLSKNWANLKLYFVPIFYRCSINDLNLWSDWAIDHNCLCNALPLEQNFGVKIIYLSI